MYTYTYRYIYIERDGWMDGCIDGWMDGGAAWGPRVDLRPTCVLELRGNHLSDTT